MAASKFNTQYNQKGRTDRKGEGPFEPTRTTQSGWMPVALQVKRLEAAGLRLQAFREAVYDFRPGMEIPDGIEDPTRRKGYDMADASADYEEAMKRLKKQKISAQELANIREEGKNVAVKNEAEEPKAE